MNMNQVVIDQNWSKKGSLARRWGIPLNHISFDYVNDCEDPKELKRIIKILESGEEGHFPELMLATEARLRQIKPDAPILNRKLCFAQKSSDLPDDENYDDILHDIAKWIKKSNQQENDLSIKEDSSIPINHHDDQPVRKSIDLTSMFNSEKPERELSIPKVSTVHHEPLAATYSKWDKYDPDVELMRLENAEKVNRIQLQKKRTINSNNLSVGANDSSSFQDPRIKFIESLSKSGTFKPQDLAMREKELGNECFNSKDYEEAISHYSTSIITYSTPEARNNRAMSYIKLKAYDKALEDLREVIESDPNNIKAHFRRGSCFKSISMYCLALRSFETTLKYDCNNLKALNYVKELKNLISNIPPKQLIRVREITRHYDQTVWDIEDPFYVSYMELSELNRQNVEYLYEDNSSGCMTECICHLCPWHEWQQRKKIFGHIKSFKLIGQKKRWKLLTSDIVPVLISKSLVPEGQKPKRLNVTEINSVKINGHRTNYSTKICDNGVNGIGKSPYEHFDDDLSIKPVSNVNDFLQSWKKVSQKNNFELYHKLLRSIKPKDLPKVISTNLDEEIMSKFLETLNLKFDHDSELDLISEYLTAMTKVNRFNLIVKMLDNKVKEGFQTLLKRVHRHTNNNLLLALL